MAGAYKDHQGFKGGHLPLNYYDIHLERDGEKNLEMAEDASVMIFTLLGEVYVGDELIEEKTAAKLYPGDEVRIKNAGEHAQVLYMESKTWTRM